MTVREACREVGLPAGVHHQFQAPRHDALDDGMDDGFLVGKVAIDLAHTHASLGRDLAHAGRMETVTHHAGTGCGDDLIAS